ncbi:APC5 protein [Elasticomyces elasticus]|nr:APC5 protein [Elasticomyces elasticus]KAK4927499.1 APC5 protein [Elasticomyces elasticus]KAK5749753.1 APC5 protein [Elasticomyces elasticus]
MARYLTPARIGLLILTEQYLSGHLASGARLKVLSFIASHIVASTGNDGQAAVISLDADAADFLSSLSGLPSDVPGRTAHDALLQRLWKLDGLDALHTLFEVMNQIVTPASESEHTQKQVSRASPLSQFIRRCSVEFTRLQFADSQQLWAAFVSWRSSTYDSWAQRNPDDAARYKQGAEAMNEHQPTKLRDAEEGHYMSAEDTNDLITFSVHHLQRMGTRAPEAMRQKLQSWISEQSDSSVQSLQHFMAFFEHWRSGQYTMALESLHRYFDYSLIGKSSSSGSETMRVYYQYALLHLSVLHADFDCWEESVEAMDECIATARENQDTACLNFALSWLLHLRQAKPDNRISGFGSVSGLLGGAAGEHDEISFLKGKARETKHWSLLSSTLLEEAKLDMYTNGSTPKSIELVTQSGFVNLQHDLGTLMPATTLFEGATYDRLGQGHLASRAHDIVKFVHGDQAPFSDRTRSLCRTAYGVAQSGRCSVALDMLQEFLPVIRGVLKLEQRVTGFIGLLQLMKSLRSENLGAAAHYHSQLIPIRALGDPELDFEFNLLEIDLFIRQGDLDAAMKAVNKHIKQTAGHSAGDIAQRLHFLVLKSTIFALSGQATKGFSIALRAASTASRLNLVPCVLEAIGALATILNDVSEFEAAKRLLDAALPMVGQRDLVVEGVDVLTTFGEQMLETRHSKVTAQAFVTSGEAQIGFAGMCAPGSSDQALQAMQGDKLIERGRGLYARLEDVSGVLECLVIRSRLARWRGDEPCAEQADAQYEQLLAHQEASPELV